MIAMFGRMYVCGQFLSSQHKKQNSINRWTNEIGNDGGFK